MRVPAGALTDLIGVLLRVSAISGVVASGRWQQNVSSGTPPELEDRMSSTGSGAPKKSRNRHTGGSGLSIARRFTEAHGGSLSAPGTETVFTLQPPG